MGWLSGLTASLSSGRGYQKVARWTLPEGEGRFIAVDPALTPNGLRALGERLGKEWRHPDNAVVMVFDDAEVARQVRQGSQVIGEKRFQRALAHQWAMYLKSTARGEESWTIYDAYPAVREVIRY